MKNLLAILAVALVAFAPFLSPALAADIAGNTTPTMAQLKKAIDDVDSDVAELALDVSDVTRELGKVKSALTALTMKVDNFAGRGHQVAVVETVPISLHPPNRNRAYHVDYYLVGHSTIPGFPAEPVGPTGRFADRSAALPKGTYLFELQQPIADESKCLAVVSHVGGLAPGIDGVGRSRCPGIYVILSDGTATDASPQKRFDGGFGVYTVTSTSGRMRLRHKFPPGTITESRRITLFKGAVKITKLK